MIFSAYPFDFGDHVAYFDLEFNVIHGRVDIYDVELVSVEECTDPEAYDQARTLFELHISDGGADAALLEAAESWGELDEHYEIDNDETL